MGYLTILDEGTVLDKCCFYPYPHPPGGPYRDHPRDPSRNFRWGIFLGYLQNFFRSFSGHDSSLRKICRLRWILMFFLYREYFFLILTIIWRNIYSLCRGQCLVSKSFGIFIGIIIYFRKHTESYRNFRKLFLSCIAIHGYEKKKKVEKIFLIKIIKLYKFDKNFDENFFSGSPPIVNSDPPHIVGRSNNTSKFFVMTLM